MNNRPDLSLILYLSSIKLNLSHIELLRYFEEGTQDFLPGKHKLLTELYNQGYVYNEEITPKGIELMNEVKAWQGVYVNDNKKPKKAKVEYSEEFLQFWSEFPSTDNQEEFQGIRTLTVKKDECAVKLENLLREYTFKTIMDCLKYEKAARLDQSRVRKANQFSFMSNSLSWLHDKKFEPYIALVEKGEYKPVIKTSLERNTETVI